MNSAEVLSGMAVLMFAALAAFAIYRWRQTKRIHQVEKWVKDYLCVRYGQLPNHLNINCSDDRLWPVLVAFDDPRGASRRSLQFACEGQRSTLSVLSDKEETR